MAREHKTKDEIVAMDISHSPDIKNLAEEVERTGKARSLKRGDQEIAKVIPVKQRAKRVSIHSESNVQTADPIWANYNPQQASAALQASVGALAHVDVDELLTDLREQRSQDSIGRPAD
jgi:hypothetical protein